jgi:hypothetical protein
LVIISSIPKTQSITNGDDMKILSRILLISVVVAYFGFIDFAQAEPYKGNRFPSDEQIQKSLKLTESYQVVGRHGDGPGMYRYFVVKKMPTGKDVIVALPVIQLDNGIWLIADGADGYIMINQ